MPDTERLYAQSDDAKHQLECIQKAADKAYAEIEAIARRLVKETLCNERDAQYLIEHAADGITDMLADIVAQRSAERDEADEAIDDAEFDDLMRDRPVVL